MSFRKNRPYRKATNMTPTRRMDAEIPAFVPEGARDSLLRIVHTQRARKLRRRGVILEKIEDGCYAWFESGVSYLNRRMQRDIAAAFRKAARSGPIYYTNEGFERIKGMAPELGAGYTVTLTIPGEPPQVLKGFASDGPFEVYNKRDAELYGGNHPEL